MTVQNNNGVEQQKFEIWADSQKCELVKWARGHKAGKYKNPAVENMWQAWLARSNQGNSLEVILPEPLCRYADDSYKAYSRRQVETLLSELGVTIIEEEV